MTLKWVIRIKALHDKTGLSPYMVAKESGVAQNTVKKYVEEEEVIVERFENTLLALLRFYGADWRDPKVADVIEVDESEESPDFLVEALAEPA